MKLVLKIVGVVLGLLIALFLLQAIASESGEVVVVTSQGADGGTAETRLWIVDYEGDQWLRSGSPMAGWYQNMQANPNIEVTRQDKTAGYVAIPKVEMRDTINAQLNAKYGWADDLIGVMFGREDAIPILLEPR